MVVATSLSGDMAICDVTNANPFCSLIPLCQGHPVLLHAINANAALHVACLYSRGDRDSHRSLTSGPSSAMVDALSAKHKSLVLLRRALENISDVKIDIDILIAVVHLFIIFELISPGGDEWTAHVQGALRLISYLQSLERHSSGFIRDSITSDCLTYVICSKIEV